MIWMISLSSYRLMGDGIFGSKWLAKLEAYFLIQATLIDFHFLESPMHAWFCATCASSWDDVLRSQCVFDMAWFQVAGVEKQSYQVQQVFPFAVDIFKLWQCRHIWICHRNTMYCVRDVNLEYTKTCRFIVFKCLSKFACN